MNSSHTVGTGGGSEGGVERGVGVAGEVGGGRSPHRPFIRLSNLLANHICILVPDDVRTLLPLYWFIRYRSYKFEISRDLLCLVLGESRSQSLCGQSVGQSAV